jgi:hypothetical protein
MHLIRDYCFVMSGIGHLGCEEKWSASVSFREWKEEPD